MLVRLSLWLGLEKQAVPRGTHTPGNQPSAFTPILLEPEILSSLALFTLMKRNLTQALKACATSQPVSPQLSCSFQRIGSLDSFSVW